MITIIPVFYDILCLEKGEKKLTRYMNSRSNSKKIGNRDTGKLTVK